ncbi:MAG: hypothetical protein CM1200mP33_1490 [Chloroflexota bacterium]|nr:MAG: hypothetical protein CM1200mP33_1490 [Chloroflexota bacterium]
MEVRLLRYDLIKTILNKSNNSPIVSNLGPTSDELWGKLQMNLNFIQEIVTFILMAQWGYALQLHWVLQ